MKYLYILLLLSIFSCKKDSKLETPIVLDGELPVASKLIRDSVLILDKDINISRSLSIELKQKKLIDKKDKKQELETLIVQKTYLKEKKDYTIDFTYPQLNEKLSPKYVNFNEYINDYYVDITGTEVEILEGKQFCDSIACKNFNEHRLINYKIYNVNDDLISVVFYKENFHTGAMHSSYSFDCMNFNLNRGVFMAYEDFFLEGTEEEFTTLLNEEIVSKIGKGELYYDCWELSQDDFFESKNNFVLNETYVEYYFDDCVMCPSYTGSYSVKIPLVKLLSVIKKYDLNPLNF